MTRSKIQDRIRKLLALSKSSNEHEAAAAAAAAQRLMVEHNIEEAILAIEEDQGEEPISDEVIAAFGKRVPWRSGLVTALAFANGADSFTRGGDIHVIGTGSAAKTVAYMYAYLSREIEKMAEDRPGSRAYKNAFRLGCAVTISRRLAEDVRAARQAAVEKVRGTGVSLAVVNNALARLDRDAQRAAKAMPKTTKAKASYSSVDGYAAGREAGHSVNIRGTSKLLVQGLSGALKS